MMMTMAMDNGAATATSRGAGGDDEKKCLLTPTSLNSCLFLQSESDIRLSENLQNSSSAIKFGPSTSSSVALAAPENQTYQFFFSPPLIYSEPALLSLANNAAYTNIISSAYSEAALANICLDQMSISNLNLPLPDVVGDELDDLDENALEDDDETIVDDAATEIGESTRPTRHKPITKILSRGFTPKSSCFFTESQPSVVTNIGSSNIPHKQSFSTREIREQHMQIQKRYRPSRKRHYTDPVDFEGILNIIGGCSWWQIWVYLLISLQQIPHAMFNLSVVYMMYQPDHWCQVPGMNVTGSKNSTYLWTNRDTMTTSIVYPKTKNKQRDILNFHSQCHYYDRGLERYEELRHMSLEDAQKAVNGENRSAPIVKCQQWEYDQDVMKNTIVTEWNLVCDDNFKRAHAHLFYSFGFLFGCLLGGFASDRFGRKPTVIGFGILSSMFGLILPYSTYFPMFLFIRFCGAVCNEAADLAAYVLCMEITGTRYRAMVGSLLQAPWAVGYATLALIAYFCKSWQYIQLITAALHTITICLICVLPESPRWLIVNNRVEEAERYIRRACREPPFPFNLCNFNKCSLPCDLELVKHAEQRKWVRRGQKANILHLLKSRALCVRTAIICIVWIATALVYYGLVIALSDQSAPGRVLFSGNFFVNNAIAGAIELPTLLICVYLMKYGRKRSQMFTLMGAAIFIFAAMAAINSKSPMVVALALMLMGKIFIQGAFNILYIFTSEMYPTVIRNSAVGFCSMIARVGSGVSSYIAILSDVTLAIVPMIIFATFSLFAGMLVMLLPETRDQPLPDTLQDAVTFLKSDHRYECYGFGGSGNAGKQNASLRGVGDEREDGSRVEGSTTALSGTATNSIVDEKCDDSATSAAHDPEACALGRKRSDTFNEVLPSIPEAPHDAEIQGTWSAALTTSDRNAPKMSAVALFEELAASLATDDLTLAESANNVESSMKNLATSVNKLESDSSNDLINLSTNPTETIILNNVANKTIKSSSSKPIFETINEPALSEINDDGSGLRHRLSFHKTNATDKDAQNHNTIETERNASKNNLIQDLKNDEDEETLLINLTSLDESLIHHRQNK